MPWSTSRPRSASYGSEHAKVRARQMARLRADGQGRCAEIVCKYRSRLITPDMDLDLCHKRSTGEVLGLGHRGCNRSEAARWARAKQDMIRVGRTDDGPACKFCHVPIAAGRTYCSQRCGYLAQTQERPVRRRASVRDW
jgi:hypothetical protein